MGSRQQAAGSRPADRRPAWLAVEVVTRAEGREVVALKEAASAVGLRRAEGDGGCGEARRGEEMRRRRAHPSEGQQPAILPEEAMLEAARRLVWRRVPASRAVRRKVGGGGDRRGVSSRHVRHMRRWQLGGLVGTRKTISVRLTTCRLGRNGTGTVLQGA